MIVERICVVGPKHRVAIIGAILARRWASAGRELLLVPTGKANGQEDIIVRPDHVKFHAELGLTSDALVQSASAVPVFAVAAKSAAGGIALPFSPFGMTRSGIEFHHFWLRACKAKQQPDLTEFSLALALEGAVVRPNLAALDQLPLQYGFSMNQARYSALLLEAATSHGARIGSEPEAADLTIDCGSDGSEPGWSSEWLTIAGGSDIPGLEWQVCVNAARRLLGFMPRLSDCANERREYTRLAGEEAERIADMRALLTDRDPQATARPALKRKIDVFTACGRIPTEDFEVFGQPEWLAALLGRGIRPRRFDRMAMAMPEQDLLQWLAALQSQIGQITAQLSGQRHVA